MKQVIETTYPISFRKKEADALGGYLKQHKSVVLIGMKRVGISNFLRFFLYHDAIAQTYIANGSKPVFIQIDLNDLIDRSISAFWTLLLTRVVDAVQNSGLPESEKRKCRRLFVQSIQLKDHFFTLDSVRKALEMIAANGLYPVLFLIRFDRLQEAVTPEFFSNLVGLHDAVKQKMSYVFTSHRPLPDLSPDVFKKQLLSVFSKDMYLTPATAGDMNIILQTLSGQYHVAFDKAVNSALLTYAGGYVQYLQLALMRLHEEKDVSSDPKKLEKLLLSDEQIIFQSEELFDSLTKKEKDILLQIKQGNSIQEDDRAAASYLWNTGIVVDTNGKSDFFSPLFSDYLGTLSMKSTAVKEFTKKEHFLFTYLLAHVGELCEREAIIEAVWPEHQELGVSDWAIDRLVARLRSKLKVINSPYSVVTVVTRGYKLIRN